MAQKLPPASSFSLLGMEIDDKLNFDKHFSNRMAVIFAQRDFLALLFILERRSRGD